MATGASETQRRDEQLKELTGTGPSRVPIRQKRATATMKPNIQDTSLKEVVKQFEELLAKQMRTIGRQMLREYEQEIQRLQAEMETRLDA